MEIIKQIKREFPIISTAIKAYSTKGNISGILECLGKALDEGDVEDVLYYFSEMGKWYKNNIEDIRNNDFVFNVADHERNLEKIESIMGTIENGSTNATDEKLLMNKVDNEVIQEKNKELKPHKLFISHSSKDKDYIDALVEMLEGIGMPEGAIVCTSVPGHGIPGGTKIFEWLRDQFLECELRIMFVLSHNYYDSAASLNEMGAAWVQNVPHTSLLLPGFNFSDMDGCIDPQEIAITFRMDEDELKHRLNELKDTLIKEHNLTDISLAEWECLRDSFILAVRKKAEEQICTEEIDDNKSGEKTVSVIDSYDDSNIPLETAFLLVYAADGQGEIIRINAKGAPPQIYTEGRRFMADNSPRESARWQEALDNLILWGWVKEVGSKGQIFRLTASGYNRADWLKDNMKINTDNEPLDELKEFIV